MSATRTVKADLQLDYATILANQGKPVHLAVSFTAEAVPLAARRPGAFCLVVDRSGSMGGLPLKHAVAAALLAVRNLRSDDHFALVAFDSVASLVVPLQPPRDRAGIARELECLSASGATNLTAGWMLGRDELAKAPEGWNRRLLLLTDGELNVGVVDSEQVRQIVASGLEQQQIRTACLGFGAKYNGPLLTELARATNGGFYHADDAEQFPAIFAHELDGLQALAVQNLRVRVRRLDFCESFQLLNDYPSVTLPDGRTEVAVGDLVSEEARQLVFALEVLPLPWLHGKPVASLEGEPVVELELAYDELSVQGISSRVVKQVLRVQAVQDPAEVKANATVIGWAAEQRAARVIRSAAERLAAADIAGARALLEAELARLRLEGNGLAGTLAEQRLQAALLKIQDNGNMVLSSKHLSADAVRYSRSSSREGPGGTSQK